MALLSSNFLAKKPSIPSISSNPTPSRNPKSHPISIPAPIFNPPSCPPIAVSAVSSASADIYLKEKLTPESLKGWKDFASRVSGEWDGFGAEFTLDGNPVELPESVVPEAFREWEVQVFDWQTQCPTLAAETEDPQLTYKLIKLLPTVGCEADAATRYSVEERIAGGDLNMVLAFGYVMDGCYVAVWPGEDRGGVRLLEVEHCLVDPGNREVRVRVVQVVRMEEGGMRMERIRAFSEQWYGPFRNGEQLGGCAIRESGFAATGPVSESEIVGVWQGKSVAVASFGSEQKDIFRELVAGSPQKSIRDQQGLVALPKQLWCSFKEKDGETWAEVGWLVDRGCSVTSRCIFRQDGSLKEMSVGRETAAPEGV